MKRILMLLFLGSCAFAGSAAVVTLAPRFASPILAQQAAPNAGLAVPTSDILKLGDRFEAVAKRVSPAVVAVEATKPGSAPAGTTSKPKPIEESGSGVLVHLEGQPGTFVLTNNHVIAHAAAEQITVSLMNGRLLKPTRVWADPESDIALLRIDSAENLPTVELGDSESARVGQWVLAIGSPFGLNQSVTHGIISARERGQVSLGSTIRIKDFLQTDAAINPGSSGGPLVNLDGQVIGINTAIASHSGSNSGVAFSIPINLIKRVSGQLLEKGSVTRGYLGLQLAPSFEPADALKLGLTSAQGALVEAVYLDTPGAAAGLRASDVLLQVDNLPIRNENHLINLISAYPAGRKIKLDVWRDRKRLTVEATVGDWTKGQTKCR